MNAASKGHLPVVLYLLNKQKANPLVRNNWGETAYDAAAAVFEVWICEVLQKAEAERWRGTTVPYNPLSVHTTVPLVLYENNRLDTRLKTLAVSGGKPKFSASGLGRHGRRSPFELRLLSPEDAGLVPAWRSDVQLPLRDSPWALPRPGSTHLEGAERSHFWLSDWTLDVTHPGVDAEEGWQYARHFDDSDDQWTAEVPLQLERLLTGGVSLSPSLGQSSSRRSPQPASWVRRRRWVRVMRRRLDIPPLPFLLPDGSMYHIGPDGSLIPYSEDSANNGNDGEGQELGVMSSNFFSMAEDYVGRARYLVGTQSEANTANVSAIDARRAIAKLERATAELRQGILADEDMERRTQAEVLLNAYSRELERRRLAAGAQGLLISGNDVDIDDDGDESDEEFHYPGASPRPSSIRNTVRAASISSGTTDYFSRPESIRRPTDLTPQLSQAPDFRVPTHEAPQKVTRWTAPSPHQIHQWEKDEDVTQCRDCQRRFNLITRRHHCRRCGRIFCDRCSSHRALLDPSDIVHGPGYLPNGNTTGSSSSQRVCQSCFEEVNGTLPGRVVGMRAASMERVFVDQERLNVPRHLDRAQSSSQLSDLAECPVCFTNLDRVGGAAEQEAHVKNCLEGGTGSTPQSAKYLVYKLPNESALIGVECVICLEEFTKGSMIARLSCFCSFHNACLSSWLQRGKSCPVHAR
ncbi:FYVE-domain-containing protein [Dendrothele bispora CBS 962.96]|uniref:FYVE-domain-containing protein n=1 Tax=Dendrothele bispora (strain CBS 962.96) TaxID=1314807 RepID=A0A4S8MZT0_DENBC|nr:FYVE-domain-containing protein [Dendrothele bispora CBS 962.96]